MTCSRSKMTAGVQRRARVRSGGALTAGRTAAAAGLPRYSDLFRIRVFSGAVPLDGIASVSDGELLEHNLDHLVQRVRVRPVHVEHALASAELVAVELPGFRD